MIGQQYTDNATNTWEKKVLSFNADTSGALGNDNGSSLRLEIWLDAGSSYKSGATPTSWESLNTADYFAGGTLNLGDNTSNDIYITGVQLEVGEFTSSTIPPFQHESFGDNLARCQRYYYKTSAVANMPFASGVCNGTTNARAYLTYPQIMRANPSLGKSNNTHFNVYSGSTNVASTSIGFYYMNTQQALLYVDVSSGLTNGQGCLIIDNGSSAYIEGSAEL